MVTLVLRGKGGSEKTRALLLIVAHRPAAQVDLGVCWEGRILAPPQTWSQNLHSNGIPSDPLAR